MATTATEENQTKATEENQNTATEENQKTATEENQNTATEENQTTAEENQATAEENQATAEEKKKKKPTTVTLKTSDKQCLTVNTSAAERSVSIKFSIEDAEDLSKPIPVPNVTSVILKKAMEYCEKHVRDGKEDDDVKAWDKDFVENMETSVLLQLIKAANYLEIEGLLDLTCQRVADMMKGKYPDKIRTMFNIKADFTEAEKIQFKEDCGWALL